MLRSGHASRLQVQLHMKLCCFWEPLDLISVASQSRSKERGCISLEFYKLKSREDKQ